MDLYHRAKRAFSIFLYGEKNDFPMEQTVSSSLVGGLLASYVGQSDSKSILLAPILNRLAVDASGIELRHVRLDEDKMYLEDIEGNLNDRLNLQANLDQSSAVMFQDAIDIMLTTGSCALVPVSTTEDLSSSSAYEILALRAGRIVDWNNKTVVVSVYKEEIGDVAEITVEKEKVAIVYNPFYNIMNRPNSTLNRLIEKLRLLDQMDHKNANAGLDLIIQMPYQVRTQDRLKEVNDRIQRLEEQLTNSRYGIAYVDSTEKITQLNREVKYNLVDQIQFLYDSLNSQLGLTPAVFLGTASDEEMISYYGRTIHPIVKAFRDSIRIKFLTKTARTQGQSIEFYQDLFKMAPISKVADAVDKFTRNEVMTSNEVRMKLGLPRSKQENADELRNKNIAKPVEDDSTPTKDEVKDEI